MPLIKILILACLLAIVATLGSALYHLARDRGESQKRVRALTIRVALSILLFVLLLIAWSQGLIEPNGLDPVDR